MSFTQARAPPIHLYENNTHFLWDFSALNASAAHSRCAGPISAPASGLRVAGTLLCSPPACSRYEQHPVSVERSAGAVAAWPGICAAAAAAVGTPCPAAAHLKPLYGCDCSRLLLQALARFARGGRLVQLLCDGVRSRWHRAHLHPNGPHRTRMCEPPPAWAGQPLDGDSGALLRLLLDCLGALRLWPPR